MSVQVEVPETFESIDSSR